MTDEQLLQRVVVNRNVMVGKPVIRGTRLTVEYILNRLAHGSSIDDLLNEYSGLSRDDVLACLLFSSKSLSSAAFMPLVSESA